MDGGGFGQLIGEAHPQPIALPRAQFDACLLLAPGSALFGPPADVLKPAALERAYGRGVAASGEAHGHLQTTVRRAA